MEPVLIADDDAYCRQILRRTLERDGYHVLEAADVDQTRALVHEHRPVVVLLDVWMPGGSGLDVAREIKADPALAQTRVIIVSGLAYSGDVAAGLAANADGYVIKPFSPAALLALIQSARDPSDPVA